MRRDVSHVPSIPKSTWFSCTPSSSVPPAARRLTSSSARLRRRSPRARAPCRRSASLVREPVRVGRCHHELAVAEAHRIPVRTGRASIARDGAADGRERREQRVGLDRRRRGRAGVGQSREVLGAVGVQPVLGGRISPGGRSSSRYSSSTSPAGSRRDRSTSRRPEHHHGTVAVHLRLERRAQRQPMSVAASSTFPLRAQQDAAKDLDGSARRHTAADDRGLRRELLARARDLQR
jgi:hypothetical protein